MAGPALSDSEAALDNFSSTPSWPLFYHYQYGAIEKHRRILYIVQKYYMEKLRLSGLELRFVTFKSGVLPAQLRFAGKWPYTNNNVQQ